MPISRRQLIVSGAGLAVLAAAWRLDERQRKQQHMQSDAKVRLEALLDAMTLGEKIGQLTLVAAELTAAGPCTSPDCLEAIRAGGVGSLINLWGAEQTRSVQRVAVEETRLGVPLLFAADVLHGHRTIFPVPLAEAAAFEPGLWQRTARVAAEEATADGLDLTFAPMLDVARDPRWGRIAEGPGEDPWIAAKFAIAKIRGFQGRELAAADSLAATAKHLGAYGAVTAGREYASVDVSDRSLHETYLPPFHAAVAEGVAAIMPALTDLAGTPMGANVSVLRDLVRDQWGFKGVIISDYQAIPELMNHGVAKDIGDAAALALRAGVDIDLMGGAYVHGLPTALERGSVTIDEVNAAVRRVLELKASLGLFDDPYRRGRAQGPSPERRKTVRQLALDAARRSIVLLKNRDGLLPIRQDARLALIGPLADAPGEMLGPWASAGRADDTVGILDGVRNALFANDIAFSRGVAIDGDDIRGLAAALELARDADVTVLCLGEAASMSGEASSRASPGLPGRQRQLAESILGLGKPVVVLLSSGRPLLIPRLFARADAVLATWFLGSEAGNAIGDVLSGRWNPTGRLPVSWPVDVGQIPIFYAQRPSGRPADPAKHDTSKYLDLPVDPLFAFGHGLSYTRFALSNLRSHPARLSPGESLTVEVDVANEGRHAGEETVFLFVRDTVASVARPVFELKGVEKIALEPGAKGTVQFAMTTDALAFLGPDLAPRLEPGDFELLVGTSAAAETLLKTSVSLSAA